MSTAESAQRDDNDLPEDRDPLVESRQASSESEEQTRARLQPKADPEALALRANPPRVVRFRKGMLAGAATAGLFALAGVAWFALDPASLRRASLPSDPAPALSDGLPEALEGLPQGYGEGPAVPALGPPLPGDLGGPILAHQRDLASDGPAPLAAIEEPDPNAQAVAAERQRIAAEATQARRAPVLVQLARPSSRDTSDVEPGSPPADRNRDPPSPGAGRAAADHLERPASRWLISAGTTIAASLITGLNSDLPGMVVAQVTEPVFDSPTGRAVLIPQGARLLGRYDSKVAYGQRRALVVWERLVLPDGRSIGLDNAPATDAGGFAGLSDRVDFHSWQLLKGIGLSTLLGVGTELTLGEAESALVRALRQSIHSNGGQAGQALVERNLDFAPTITVRPGYPVKVLVHKDLVLPPWRG